MILEHTILATPVGPVGIVSGASVLRAVTLRDHDDHAALQRRLGGAELRRVDDAGGFASAFRRYFDGELDALDALPVDTGGTPFQQAVWTALRAIPCGHTVSYGTLAARIGSPTAVRAVGAANGRNPVPIVIPCHRVIAANGTLWGYGGGLDMKRWLLRHEGALQEELCL
jgi:methylated-DNA-[protein]-cysteine S-methyltransferase